MASAPKKPTSKTGAPTVSDSLFLPRPVDPEAARRKVPEVDVERSVVELTSPVGLRLRVPAPGADGAVSSDGPPPEKPKP